MLGDRNPGVVLVDAEMAGSAARAIRVHHAQPYVSDLRLSPPFLRFIRTPDTLTSEYFYRRGSCLVLGRSAWLGVD